MSGLLFTSNTALGTANSAGGGLFMNATGLITSSTFQNNVAASRGGAIGALSAATINLYYTEDATLTGNTSITGTGGFAYLESDAILNFDIATGKTVRVGVETYGGSVADSIASNASATLLKSGSGTLILNADSSLYSGTTRVTTNGGSLLLGHRDAKLGGLVIAESGAAFGGQGVATGDVTLQDNSSLVIGMDHNAGATGAATFTIDGMLTLDGASLKFDVINATTSEQLVVGDILFAGGQNYIDLNVAQSGVYTLINLTSDVFAASATEAFITTKNGEALSARIDQAYSLTDSDTKLVLTLAKNSYARTWTGASALWNATAEN